MFYLIERIKEKIIKLINLIFPLVSTRLLHDYHFRYLNYIMKKIFNITISANFSTMEK